MFFVIGMELGGFPKASFKIRQVAFCLHGPFKVIIILHKNRSFSCEKVSGRGDIVFPMFQYFHLAQKLLGKLQLGPALFKWEWETLEQIELC